MKKITHIVGIDEVGRGPLAGPVMVCAFAVPMKYAKKNFKGVTDSKKLSEKRREEISAFFRIEKGRGNVRFETAYVTAQKIDEWGMTKSVQTAINRALRRLNLDPKKTLVLLDGLLKAPEEFIYQKTIIKGDQKEAVIGAASIIAKVRRDSMMTKYAKKYPGYGFEIHKGYGTKAHIRTIKDNGESCLHRKSFLGKILT